MEGWIKLHRQLCDNPIWTLEKFTPGQAWVDLILNANHADGYFMVRGNRVDIKRGQIGWSEITMATRWKWSRTRVRNFLKSLEKEQQIEQQKTTVTSVITILNYGLYQKEEQQKEQQSGQQKDNRKTAERQQKNINKNDKNDKNDKKNKPPIVPPLGGGEKSAKNIQEQRFEHFWKTYPKKRSKGQAEKAWDKIKPDEQLHNRIIQSLEQAKTSAEWTKEGGQFIPYPATWLNAKGWEDEYKPAQKQEQPKGGQTNVGTQSKRRVSRTDTRDWEKILGVD